MKTKFGAAILVLASFGISHNATAQEPPPYTLTIPRSAIPLLGKALGKMPYEEVAAFVANLDQQIAAQNPKREDAKPAEKPSRSDGKADKP